MAWTGEVEIGMGMQWVWGKEGKEPEMTPRLFASWGVGSAIHQDNELGRH